MLISAAFETCGIGLVVPFVKIIAEPESIAHNRWLGSIYRIVGAKNSIEFLIYISFGFFLFYIIKNIFLGFMVYLQQRFICSKSALLGEKLFRVYLNSSYTFHLSVNAAELFRNVDIEVPKIIILLRSMLTLCTELCVLICILIMLLLVNPIIVICSCSLLGMISAFYYMIFKKYAKIWGDRVQSANKYINQAILEGFGAIKEVKILGKENYFANRYYSNIMERARATWKNTTLNYMPRYFFEVVAVGSVVLIIILLQGQGKEIKTFLPILCLFAMAIIRIMPSLSHIVTSLKNIGFYSSAVEVVYRDISQFNKFNFLQHKINQPKQKVLLFKKNIKIQNICYSYPNSEKEVLHDVSLQIARATTIGFAGPSGSGKTTLANIILGLLVPSKGNIYADDQDVFQDIASWQRNIGFVPQSIYLLDATIRNNVAFGLSDQEIDDLKVWEALKIAQLDMFVKQQHNGLDTFIGENGVRLSGGQRQRIGIARAVYHKQEIIILDEATSALDNQTEKNVSLAIEKLSGLKTIIIIAHRFSTIKQCDTIYFMQEGSIIDSGSFDELILKNQDFKLMAESDKHHI